MIDIHCHLLPGIDDGPTTLEQAMALAKALVDDGITHAVATPHVFPGRFENRRTSIEDEFERFASQLADSGIPLALGWAGEVRLTPEVLDLLALQELPYLGQSGRLQAMLLEMPDGQIPLGSDRFITHLMARGVRPVIVHPERNRAVMENTQRLQPFVAQGCAVQITAGSLVGQFGAKAQATAKAILDAGWVDVIASDAHNLTGRRPRMAEAAAWLGQHYGAAVVDQLTYTGPLHLCGGHLPGTALTPSNAGQKQPAERLSSGRSA